jgi:hypothetical protein
MVGSIQTASLGESVEFPGHEDSLHSCTSPMQFHSSIADTQSAASIDEPREEEAQGASAALVAGLASSATVIAILMATTTVLLLRMRQRENEGSHELQYETDHPFVIDDGAEAFEGSGDLNSPDGNDPPSENSISMMDFHPEEGLK